MIAAVTVCAATTARAEVTRFEVKTRATLPAVDYEKITGTIYFAVDPRDPHNARVVDLDKAPRNATGRVEFSADFYLVRPRSGGNGVALVDIVNRGRKTVIPNFNRARGTDSDVGDGFLMRHGFTVAAVGWEFDVAAGAERLHIAVPAATDQGRPITGIVRASFTPDRRDPTFRVGDLAAYTPVDPAGPDSTLTVRRSVSGPAETIPRDRWQLSGATITLTGGFEPGRIYELAFRAANPPVAGLGFVAVRDFASWLKHDGTAPAAAKHVYAFGSSQSGRFLRTFLYQGFNADERNRQALDAVLANIAGASRLDLNRRWSTPTALHMYAATAYPFSDRGVRDPVSGAEEGLLDHARAARHQPKVFYTNTGVEYWGGGRSAALLHVTPDGARDVPFPDNVRAYFFAGTQHGPGAFPPAPGSGQQRANPTDYWWSMRALLLALDAWTRHGTAPPPGRYPSLADGTLVRADNVAFPAIPGVQSPRTLAGGARIANPFITGGGGEGAPLPLLVPQVDADGNDRAGIRLPEVAVPLATYTGWNFRRPEIGGTDQLVALLGSYIPLARTKSERAERGDPRASVEERYPTRDRYLAMIGAAADRLVRDRYLLADDVAPVVARAGAHWDLVTAAATTASSRSTSGGGLRPGGAPAPAAALGANAPVPVVR